MELWHAILLGAVEGFTEFLPISSTGHLILTSHLLRLHGDAVNTFEIVIQAGALAAVVGWYRHRVVDMWRGLWGKDLAGRRLLGNLLVSFLPAAITGVLLQGVITHYLFTWTAVIGALALGGVIMLVVDAWERRHPSARSRSIDEVSRSQAAMIGLVQCLSLWPGTSRAMVTILGGWMVGLPFAAAAEYSFLLALPTLGAACAFDLWQGGMSFWQGIGPMTLIGGFSAAALVAAWAIRAFIPSLTRWGLRPFGWYRLMLAASVWAIAR